MFDLANPALAFFVGLILGAYSVYKFFTITRCDNCCMFDKDEEQK